MFAGDDDALVSRREAIIAAAPDALSRILADAGREANKCILAACVGRLALRSHGIEARPVCTRVIVTEPDGTRVGAIGYASEAAPGDFNGHVVLTVRSPYALLDPTLHQLEGFAPLACSVSRRDLRAFERGHGGIETEQNGRLVLYVPARDLRLSRDSADTYRELNTIVPDFLRRFHGMVAASS